MSPPPDPSPTPPANLPAPRSLDRTALERVLARAGELQIQSGDPGDGSSELSEEQLVELGTEVGLSPHHLRQALAEERTRVALPDEGGVATRWFGPASVSASRTVRGTAEKVLAATDRWMLREECLQVKRRFADRVTWEARRDFLGSIKRGFNLGGRGYALTKADEVGATVVPVDDGRVLVRLDATLQSSRRTVATWTGVVVGGVVASAVGVVGLAAVMGGSLVIAGLTGSVWTLAGGAVGMGVSRAHRRQLARMQLALEQILDQLEHGEPSPPSLLSSLLAPRTGLRP